MRLCSYRLLGAAILATLLAVPLLGTAQQRPAGSAPPQEAQGAVERSHNAAPMWREVRSGEPAYTSIPGRETNVLIQSLGETWREVRNIWLTPIGGWLIAGVVVLIAIFYAWKGKVTLHDPPTGRLIERFTVLERYLHWLVAISFCILGVTGLIILLGKHVLLPVIGYALFSGLTVLSKNVHNFVGPIFVLSLLVFIPVYLKDNWPRGYDFAWFKSFGGMFGGRHVPSGKYNAGEKVWFWVGVVGLGLIVSASGLVLNFPNFDQGRAVMIVANIAHIVAAVLIMVLALGHIYMGTIGVEGAYRNMRYGYTDETWAREHHEYWYEAVKSGKVKAAKATGLPDAPVREQRLGGESA
jgi:formate dehydrogenase subunit gamma